MEDRPIPERIREFMAQSKSAPVHVIQPRAARISLPGCQGGNAYAELLMDSFPPQRFTSARGGSLNESCYVADLAMQAALRMGVQSMVVLTDERPLIAALWRKKPNREASKYEAAAWETARRFREFRMRDAKMAPERQRTF